MAATDHRSAPRPRTARARRPLGAAVAVGAGALSAVLLTAGPAAAHVEVESENARALAVGVTVTFEAESESDTAGISGVRVVLPEGIAPADVRLGKGPEGWRLTPGADGYTVRGPALPVGRAASYSIVVRQLPDAVELPFKTLQSYADGRVDRWIGTDGGGGNPAPVLKLQPAARGARTLPPLPPSPTASPSPSAAPTTAAPTEPVPTTAPESSGAAATAPTVGTSEEDEGLSAGAWIGIGLATALVLAGVAFFLLRRRPGSGA
ncbi:DUF1775 domain-containing protein [Streptomyces sp. NPDC097619]|uniref:DUF1775 domain-containing protein n=1 Tax=Streptomyces sp. NPDC097619 TaxID=3157228 RepID=UPI0033237711